MSNSVEQCLSVYSGIINANPLLTKAQEDDLFKTIKMYKTGKARENAREKLFNSNLKLVIHHASYYSSRCQVPFEDIISAGVEGLGEAINRFNPSFKTKFSTYCVPWIKLKIFQLLESFSSTVYVPKHILIQSRKYHKMLEKSKESPITESEIMKELDVSERVFNNIKLFNKNIVSLNATMSEDSDTEVQDCIEDTNSISPDEAFCRKDIEALVRNEVNKLDDEARDIIYRRYLSAEKDNLGELGEAMGVSGERIRQIEFNALKKLRKRLAKKL